jgi:hypothetical protein
MTVDEPVSQKAISLRSWPRTVGRRGWDRRFSNTCDNFQQSSPVLIVPVEAYEFDDAEASDAKKWLQISADATGVGSAKLFYLPRHPDVALGRSHAVLNRVTPLSHKYLKRCFAELNGQRLCGLTPAAPRHLQYTLSLMFSRNARDDDAWPSVEDFRLKAAWLRESLQLPGRQKGRYEAELRAIEALVSELSGETPPFADVPLESVESAQDDPAKEPST